MLDGTNLATNFSAVTPSDSTVVNFKALYVGGTGNVVIKNDAGASVTFTAVPVGMLPVSGMFVMAATTATNIVALF